MHAYACLEKGVQLGLEILGETPVHALGQVGQVLALHTGRDRRAARETPERLEEAPERTPHPVHLSLAEHGRSVVRVKLQGLVVICHRERIVIEADPGITHHSKYLGRRILFLECLVGLVLMYEDVVSGEGGLLIAAHYGLDVVKRADDLVETVLPGIEVDKGIIQPCLAGIVLQESFIYFHGEIVLPGHGIKRGKVVAVPVVVRINADGLSELGNGGIRIVLQHMAQCHVIVRSVIVRKCFSDDGETGHCGFDIAVVIILYRIY